MIINFSEFVHFTVQMVQDFVRKKSREFFERKSLLNLLTYHSSTVGISDCSRRHGKESFNNYRQGGSSLSKTCNDKTAALTSFHNLISDARKKKKNFGGGCTSVILQSSICHQLSFFNFGGNVVVCSTTGHALILFFFLPFLFCAW